jgi:acylphosphatase
MKSVRVRIEGRVQGVGYRTWVADKAEVHGLSGWVRNRRDGSVEAVFAGDAGDVDAIVEACLRGPSGAHVTAITASNYVGAPLSRFTVLPTG